MVSPLVLPSPATVGDEWGNSLNVAVQSVNADVEALKVRSIAAGLGLTGGGDLTQNRSFAVDFAASGAVSATKAVRADDARLSDARTPTAHGHAIGDVTSLQAALDAKAATAHTHAIGDVTSLQAALDAKALATRLITAGSGLTGGGNLTADRTLAVDLATVAPPVAADASAVGAATKPARQDHTHGAPLWATYVPTIAGGNGAVSAYTVNLARYWVWGKFVTFTVEVTITTAGDAAGGNLHVGVPFQVAGTYKGMVLGRENAATGFVLQGLLNPNATLFHTFDYSNGGAIVQNGRSFVFTGSYERA